MVVLPLHRFHNVPQVSFLFRQDSAQGVYLCRMHIRFTTGFQGLQQAVGVQAEGVVTGAIGFFPPGDALAEGGKPGDVAMYVVDVATHLPYFGGLGFYLPYPLTFITKMAAMLLMTATNITYPKRISSLRGIYMNPVC